ncbi:MAG: methylated-DNA--[protein]-cysteine S-methyltransferase [Opitutales bacterium]|nr:methylated-DNA--[protein]-cysteine S-methyltransferase [Opitutales bacterium]
MSESTASPRPKSSPIHWLVDASPWGKILVAATDRGICLLQFRDDLSKPEEVLAREFPADHCAPAHGEAANRIHRWLSAAWQDLAAKKQTAIPLDLAGTPFQKRVWAHLRTIPPGKPSTYTAVAQAIGHPRAVRGVASACARNRVALLVPCHRVTRVGGAPGGYRWGLERKVALLQAEGGLPAAS